MMTSNLSTLPRLSAKPSLQRGVVLMIALIALVALSLAGIALIRSVDTGNVIAGNLAFRQAAVQAGDIGIQGAFIALPSVKGNTAIANRYYPSMQNLDSRGVPTPTTAIAWDDDGAFPCRDNSDATVTCSTQTYQVKYVIERLCTVPAPTDYQNQCQSDIGTGKGGSKGAFGAVFSSVNAIYYRVTVRVKGPRNTISWVQAILSIG